MSSSPADAQTSTKPPGPLEAAGVLDDAVIIKALFVASNGSIGPREADDLYLWEIATLLNVGDELNVEAQEQQGDEDRLEYIRARIAHAEGRGPKPEARALSPETFNALAATMAGTDS